MIERIRAFYGKYREGISYVFWGDMTTLVSYVSYFLFSRGFHLDEMIANALAWVCGATFSFVVNKIFVFRSAGWSPSVLFPEIWKYVSARIFAFVLDMAIMYVGVKVLHIYDLIVKIAANVIVVIVNYVLSKFLIFRKPHGDGVAGEADGK